MSNRLLLLGLALVVSTAAGLSIYTRVHRHAYMRAAPRRAPPAPPAETAPPGVPPAVVAPAVAKLPAPTESPPAETFPEDEHPTTLAEQRAALYRALTTESDVTPAQLAEVERIFSGSPYLGQGNPAISRHPMTPAQCRAIRDAAGLIPVSHPPCDRRYMVPVFDPGAGETVLNARLCIDQFEFPDIPCAYPVVNVTAREAALLCAAVGKRICDAHEWEGACAGALHPPEVEYAFGENRPYATWLHNHHREIRWAYGREKNHALCATGSKISPNCGGGGWTSCGSNTYPAGAFPDCVSPFGVYDQHGNAAEHMNLPLSPDELASQGGTGATERKGSWFIFQQLEAHEDDCRWRAKDWHPSRLMDVESHRNYHLGLRCCADVAAISDAGTAAP